MNSAICKILRCIAIVSYIIFYKFTNGGIYSFILCLVEKILTDTFTLGATLLSEPDAYNYAFNQFRFDIWRNI